MLLDVPRPYRVVLRLSPDVEPDDEKLRAAARRMAKAYAQFSTPGPFDMTTLLP